MRQQFRAIALALTIIGAAPLMSSVALAASPTIVTNMDGSVLVTLEDGQTVTLPAALASQVLAILQNTDNAVVTQQLQVLVAAVAANNPNLAAAIAVYAASTTADPLRIAAIQAGVVGGNPGAATIVAANLNAEGGIVVAGGGAPPGGGGVPVGGTGGGGSDTPSGN